MPDPYLYEDVPVLRNKLGIKTEKILDLVEAEQSRANMMLLYERPFSSFSPAGLREIHRFLFGDIYDWAGEYRIINIQKAERLLGGRRRSGLLISRAKSSPSFGYKKARTFLLVPQNHSSSERAVCGAGVYGSF